MGASLSIACQTALPRQPGHWKFDCSSCLETVEDEAMLVIHDDKICASCFESDVKPQFAAALADESQYPVMWGGKKVVLKHYRHAFTKDFKDAWVVRMKEYDVMPNRRLYCQGEVNAEICGRFLGEKQKLSTSITCNACGHQTCSLCTSTFITSNFPHGCSFSTASTEPDPFAGLKRGTDYQLCPGCDCAIELRDGCNHVTCRLGRCRTHFCFLCGEEATRESGHWRVGKPCPLYHQKDAANAQYDGGLQGVDPEEIAAVARLQAEAHEDLAIGINGRGEIPDELHRRRIDRASLHAILRELTHEIDEWPRRGLSLQQRDEQLRPLRSMLAYVDILFKSLFAYTIDLETDEAAKDILKRILDHLGPRIIIRRNTASTDMRTRFSDADEIFHRIVAAAIRQIPERVGVGPLA